MTDEFCCGGCGRLAWDQCAECLDLSKGKETAEVQIDRRMGSRQGFAEGIFAMIGNCDNCDRVNVPVSNGQFCGCDTTQCHVCQGDVLDPYGELEDSVGQHIRAVFASLDELIAMAADPEKSSMIFDEEVALGQMLSRCQLLVSFLAARKVPTLKMVQNNVR